MNPPEFSGGFFPIFRIDPIMTCRRVKINVMMASTIRVWIQLHIWPVYSKSPRRNQAAKEINRITIMVHNMRLLL